MALRIGVASEASKLAARHLEAESAAFPEVGLDGAAERTESAHERLPGHGIVAADSRRSSSLA